MTTSLDALSERLEQIADAIPTKFQQNTWNVPSVDRADLIAEAQAISTLIEERGSEFDPDDEEQIEPLVKRLDFLLANTLPQLQPQAAAAIPAYMLTIRHIKRRLIDLLPPLDEDAIYQQVLQQKRRTDAVEARLNDVQPRTENLETMLGRIEAAYQAADRLPADLEDLSKANQQITQIADEAATNGSTIENLLATIKEQEENLERIKKNASEILKKCETAYASSTSVGLAKVFADRSKSLSWSIYVWVAGLIVALISAGIFGSQQLQKLTSLMTSPNVPVILALLNMLLAVFAVGAPIWFAWLATKQIGQRFRLAEDYAFKASISTAYEGYRREAARIDESFDGQNLEVQLLQSALTRLDELPLRLVEVPTHGSPWSEMLHSEVIREAIKTVPGFVNQVKDIAVSNIATYKGSRKTRTDKPPTPKVEELIDSE